MLPEVNLDDLDIQTQLRQEIVLPTSSVNELRKLGRSVYRVVTQVNAPTLVLQGFQDTTVPPKETRILLARLGGPVTLHEFSGDHDETSGLRSRNAGHLEISASAVELAL